MTYLALLLEPAPFSLLLRFEPTGDCVCFELARNVLISLLASVWALQFLAA